jgi:hypothetical protein
MKNKAYLSGPSYGDAPCGKALGLMHTIRCLTILENDLPGTNALAYLASLSVAMKQSFSRMTPVVPNQL